VSGQKNTTTPWIGIPSVPPQRIGQALISFYLAITAATAIEALLSYHLHTVTTWQHLARGVFDNGSSIVAWALVMTWPIMEAIRMVLAGLWEKRTFRRGREQGREETQRLWEAWLKRRQQAEDRGETFTEPPPRAETTENA